MVTTTIGQATLKTGETGKTCVTVREKKGQQISNILGKPLELIGRARIGIGPRVTTHMKAGTILGSMVDLGTRELNGRKLEIFQVKGNPGEPGLATHVAAWTTSRSIVAMGTQTLTNVALETSQGKGSLGEPRGKKIHTCTQVLSVTPT